MTNHGYCPQCKLEVPESRTLPTLICPHCGFTNSKSFQKAQKEVSQRFIKLSVGLSTFMVIAFMHAVTWDQFFFEVIPLKAKQIVGMANATDYGRLAEMCKTRKDSECVEHMLTNKVQAEPQNIENLAELGQVQFLRNNFKGSAATLKKYFAEGGLSLDASYTYARALGQIGQVDESSEAYKKVLASKPDMLQISVTQNYVRMLMDAGRAEQAKLVIESIRVKGSNAAMFMESEMQQIKQTSIR